MRTIFTTLILIFVFGVSAQAKPRVDQQLKLAVNQQSTITKDKLKIKFVAVVEDSRCPSDTNCVWAGNAKIKITVGKTKSDARTFEMNTSGESQSVNSAGYEIKLVGLSPQPATNIRINRNGYTATFGVRKL